MHGICAKAIVTGKKAKSQTSSPGFLTASDDAQHLKLTACKPHQRRDLLDLEAFFLATTFFTEALRA